MDYQVDTAQTPPNSGQMQPIREQAGTFADSIKLWRPWERKLMRAFVGIDLGSMTTEAIVLDENSQVIGRGITSSHSNYATAARVASEEARTDGRFTLFRRAPEHILAADQTAQKRTALVP